MAEWESAVSTSAFGPFPVDANHHWSRRGSVVRSSVWESEEGEERMGGQFERIVPVYPYPNCRSLLVQFSYSFTDFIVRRCHMLSHHWPDSVTHNHIASPAVPSLHVSIYLRMHAGVVSHNFGDFNSALMPRVPSALYVAIPHSPTVSSLLHKANQLSPHQRYENGKRNNVLIEQKTPPRHRPLMISRCDGHMTNLVASNEDVVKASFVEEFTA
ncbi:hypothetical protein Sjap_019910 [Stephania japonica]|uniref:Uncharacterized protein n=1 Tax=Stephania japonica TaxID=461633 RepID=A0AAP0F131_9MAGN